MASCPACGGTFDSHVKFCPEDGTALTDGCAFNPDGSHNSGARLGAVVGSYRLMGILGEGGMGTVYLAEHARLGRRVAVKLLHPEYAINPNLVRRFFGEARAVNQIDHENIVDITDFVDSGEEKYIVMELLDGMNLSDLLKHEGPLPIPRMQHLGTQICSALVAVHAAGVIHRDLKPANIFVTHQGDQYDFVKLLDFGIAKLSETCGEEALAETAAGAVLGTPGYVAPEQLTGKNVDARADIYAVGVLFYQMVTGRKPLGAKSFGEMVLKQLTATPPRPSELADIPHKLPVELEDLILQCLERDPDHRPANMAEVEARLRAIDATRCSGDTWLGSRLDRLLSAKHLLAAAAATLLFLAAAVGLTLGIGGSEPDTDPAPRPAVASAPQPTPTEAATTAETAETADEEQAVEIVFASTPQYAEVFRAGSEDPLGMAPFSLSLKRSNNPETFEFRLAGHQSVRRTVALSENTRVSVNLTAEPRQVRPTNPAPAPRRRTTRSRPRRKTTNRPKSRRGTLDPFAEQ